MRTPKIKKKILKIPKEEKHIAFKRTRITFSEFSSLPLNAVRKEII